MNPIDSMTFREADSGEECFIAVRADATKISLALSREHDGGVEVFLDRSIAKRIARALQRAIAVEHR